MRGHCFSRRGGFLTLTEPTITINGARLTKVQAAAVRIGVNDFVVLLNDVEFRKMLGRFGPLYLAALKEVQVFMGNGKQ
jgi:hypothetical protein